MEHKCINPKCNETFESKREDAKYCSDKCRKAVKRNDTTAEAPVNVTSDTDKPYKKLKPLYEPKPESLASALNLPNRTNTNYIETRRNESLGIKANS